jgi:hypothetical protein
MPRQMVCDGDCWWKTFYGQFRFNTGLVYLILQELFANIVMP